MQEQRTIGRGILEGRRVPRGLVLADNRATLDGHLPRAPKKFCIQRVQQAVETNLPRHARVNVAPQQKAKRVLALAQRRGQRKVAEVQPAAGVEAQHPIVAQHGHVMRHACERKVDRRDRAEIEVHIQRPDGHGLQFVCQVRHGSGHNAPRKLIQPGQFGLSDRQVLGFANRSAEPLSLAQPQARAVPAQIVSQDHHRVFTLGDIGGYRGAGNVFFAAPNAHQRAIEEQRRPVLAVRQHELPLARSSLVPCQPVPRVALVDTQFIEVGRAIEFSPIEIVG